MIYKAVRHQKVAFIIAASLIGLIHRHVDMVTLGERFTHDNARTGRIHFLSLVLIDSESGLGEWERGGT